MRYALVVENRVMELFDREPVFHADLEVIEVDDSVEVNWIRNGNVFEAPPPAPPGPFG